MTRSRNGSTIGSSRCTPGWHAWSAAGRTGTRCTRRPTSPRRSPVSASSRGRESTSRSRRGSVLAADERPGEVVRVEGAQVVELLPHADQLHGQAELVRDRDRDAALRRAVELRQGDAADAGSLAEEPRLLEAVLT